MLHRGKSVAESHFMQMKNLHEISCDLRARGDAHMLAAQLSLVKSPSRDEGLKWESYEEDRSNH